ncbi:hypothetical protein HMPREF1869_01415 [Bacteroidales bacterium KA00251]|nr:hypothetical protein HMPREF1869_01415 [Bacteroidales bacterium KA00251]
MFKMRLLHKGESLCCFRDSALSQYGGMLPSDLTLCALRFILSAKSRQSCSQDLETVDFCNSLKMRKPEEKAAQAFEKPYVNAKALMRICNEYKRQIAQLTIDYIFLRLPARMP